MVNLAGRTLLYGPLKFKVDSVAKPFVMYRYLFLTFIASKNLKLFLTPNYVLKRANDLKTIQIESFCIRGVSEI